MKKLVTSVFALSVLSTNVFALDCVGNVNAVRVIKTGTVELKIDGPVENNYINICSVSSDYNGVAPETCKSWLAIGLTARTAGKKVKLWNVEGGTCATSGGVVLDKFSMY